MSEMLRNDEPLLQEPENPLVIFPIEHHDVWAWYKKQVASFWTAEEIDMTVDLTQWDRLTSNEQRFIKYILAFFAASDGIVIDNLSDRVINEIQMKEAKYFYKFQMMMEQIHSEVYSSQIVTLIQDQKERKSTLEAVQHIPAIQEKARWAQTWSASDTSFAERLVAFAAVEGIFFQGSFCAIFYLKKRNLMPGLCLANEFISKDENMHTEFACHLFKTYVVNKPSREVVLTIIESAVEVEKKFIVEAMPVELIGMNSKLMSEYIEHVADNLLVLLGFEKHWNTPNPFEWMVNMQLKRVTNFFEDRVSEYQKAGVLQKDIGADMYEELDDF